MSSTTTEAVEETTTTAPNDTTTTESIRTTTTSPNDTTTTFPIPQFRQSPRQVEADASDPCTTTTVVNTTEPADTDSSAPADSDSSAPAIADDGELSNDVTQPAGAAPALARTGSNILPFAAVGAMLLLIGAAFVRKARATS